MQKAKLLIIAILYFHLFSFAAMAANQTLYGVKIANVAVTGGEDTSNPGVSCIKLDVPVVEQCGAGYVAIPKNNSDMIRAALVAKSSNANLSIYYNSAQPPAEGHCPGIVFTPCQLISIILIE